MAFIARALKAQQIPVLRENAENQVTFKVTAEDREAWEDLVGRLNAVFGTAYALEFWAEEGTLTLLRPDLYGADDERLARAITDGEHRPVTPSSSQDELDIHLTYACNENCGFCSMRPLWEQLARTAPESVHVDETGVTHRPALGLDALIDALGEASPYAWYHITGGEPTLHEGLPTLVKWLYEHRPESGVAFHTNGRLLQDERLVRTLRRYTRRAYFVVPLHGPNEAVHNAATGVHPGTGNPFQETLRGIQNLRSIFGDCKKRIRTEIVLTRENIGCLLETVRFAHDTLGIRYVDVTYPSLKGYSEAEAESLAPALNEVTAALAQVNGYLATRPDLTLQVRGVPWCAFAPLLPLHFRRAHDFSQNHVTFSVIGEPLSSSKQIRAAHEKRPVCTGCALSQECLGVQRAAPAAVMAGTVAVGKDHPLATRWTVYRAD